MIKSVEKMAASALQWLPVEKNTHEKCTIYRGAVSRNNLLPAADNISFFALGMVPRFAKAFYGFFF
jgi:hypothetical protein